jgi:hypothetical protein
VLYRGRSAADLAGGFALPDAGDLPRRIEDQYAARLGELPAEVQRLVLLAAADPVGDPALILRAAEVLGLDPGSMNLAVAADLLEFGATGSRVWQITERVMVFQDPNSMGLGNGNENSIRIMEPTAQYPSGYVRMYNSSGEPVDCNLNPGPNSDTHLPEDEPGPFPELPLGP